MRERSVLDAGASDASIETGMDAGIDATAVTDLGADTSVSDLGVDVNESDLGMPAVGVIIDPVSGLSTSETGTTATFVVALASAPSADVILALSSSDTAEVTVSPSSLTFTPTNWSSAQLVTVSGVDDVEADGNQSFTIVTAPSVSTDLNYADFDPLDVSGVNLDDETPGIVVAPTHLTTNENGSSASFTVALQSQPGGTVLVPITNTDTSEGDLSTTSVMFTSANWNIPVLVEVTGVDDAEVDGDQSYDVNVGPATSADLNYDGLLGSNVVVTNVDDDVAQIIVAPASGLVTTESGTLTTFSVRLSTIPSADVELAITSTDSSEGTVAPSTLTFASSTWNVDQTVTVTGIDDAIVDGNQTYDAVVHVQATSDAHYASLADALVAITNIDDDAPAIVVSPTAGLVTTEAAGMDTFAVTLTSQPTASVLIGLSSDLTSEGTVSPATVTLTTSDWSTPHIVTVRGVDDAFDDGDRVYHIVTAAALSGDSNYASQNASDVTVINTDDDTAGVTVTPIAGLSTSEAGGFSSFTIVLDSRPTASVSISLASSDLTEGTVSPASVTFTSANWATPQSVTVTGVNDLFIDGDIAYSIVTGAASSTDMQYNGRAVADVMVVNTDNDTAAITVTPTSGLTTTEAGGTATFSITLTAQPSANVTVAVTSTNTAEGTVSPASVVLTSGDWNMPHTVTVTGVNDLVDEGDVAYTIVTDAATSSDTNFAGLNPADVSVTNLDNDAAGITVSPTSGLTTTEAGGTAMFSLVLTTLPSASVSVPISSSDLTEGTVSAGSVTFTTGNWNVPQTITVTGVNDSVSDGNVVYTITTGTATSSDGTYMGIDPSNVTVTNTDDEVVSLTVTTPNPLRTWEGGGSTAWTIALAVQPTANVTVPLSVSDATEGSVSVASLTFTTMNWNVPQGFTVSGVDDAIEDGDVSYSLVLEPLVGTDPGHMGYNPPDYTLVNQDDDVLFPGTVDPSTGQPIGGDGGFHTLSSDGRYIGLYSGGIWPLVPEDTNGLADAYILDRLDRTVTLMSRATDGTQSNGILNGTPEISDDGQNLAFLTNGNSLVLGDTNGLTDVFVTNRNTRVCQRASVSNTGAELNGASLRQSISADGRYVMFGSAATNVVVGDTNGAAEDCFVRDMIGNTTVRISVTTAGTDTAFGGYCGGISADGRYGVFWSAGAYEAGDTNSTGDVYVRDMMLNTTTRVSVSSAGAQGTMIATNPSISATGRYVAFQSTAPNLVPGDSNGVIDVFVRDTQLNTTTRASFINGGVGEGNGHSEYPVVSQDGRHVVFQSLASNLVSGDTDGFLDIYATDLITLGVTRVSRSSTGGDPNVAPQNGIHSISADGRFASYETTATNTGLSTGGWTWQPVVRLP